MTKKEAKELLPVIQAYAEGKDIEMFFDNKWITGTNLDFTLSPENYRIKPEPEYRPFKNAEECWNEMMKHQPFGWIRNKATNVRSLVNEVSPLSDTIKWAVWNISVYSMYDTVTFADGAPFGIKEE